MDSIIILLFLLDIFFNIKIPWSRQPTFSSQPTSPLHLFMNFRGKDTRHNFTSLLYNALFHAGINVFLDEEGIGTGRQIDSEIVGAINNSMGAIIIFSKGYASSPWCLDELVLILEHKKRLGSSYLLFPVYLDGIQPDDIFASYGKAMEKHNKWFWRVDHGWRKKVKAWRTALGQVGGYKGRILDGNWCKFINDTVKDVRKELLAMGIIINPQRTHPTNRKYHLDVLDTIYELVKKLVITLLVISIPHFIAYVLPVLRPIIGRFFNQCGYLLDAFLRSFFTQHLYNQFLQQPAAPTSNVTSVEMWKDRSRRGNLSGNLRHIVVLLCLSLMILCWLFVKKTRNSEVDLSYDRDQRQHSFKLKYYRNFLGTIYELIKDLVITSILNSIPHFIAYNLPVIRPIIGKFINQSEYLLDAILQLLFYPTPTSIVTSVEIWKVRSGRWNLSGNVTPKMSRYEKWRIVTYKSLPFPIGKGWGTMYTSRLHH